MAAPDAGDAFWTACPHCCYVHSYPRLYLGRRLRCPITCCRNAFSADELPSAPPLVPGTDMYLCTWAFFPLGPPSVPQGWTPFTPFNPKPSASAATRVGPTSRKKVGVCLKGRARLEAEEESEMETDCPSFDGGEINIDDTVELSELGFRDDDMEFFNGMQ